MKTQHTDFERDVDSFRTEINLKEVLWKYLSKWPWILLSVALALVLCYNYLRYTQPLYEATSTILIRDPSKGQAVDELSTFSDLGIINAKNNLENEIEILKSRTLMRRVCMQLQLNISYSVERSPLPLELYQASPIIIKPKKNDSLLFESSNSFDYIPGNKGSFKLRYRGEESTFLFGEFIDLGFGEFQILEKPEQVLYSNKTIQIAISPIDNVASSYAKKLTIETVNAKSNVIRMRMRDAVVIRAKQVLNALTLQYKLDAISDKNQASINTAEFISERISFITEELSALEGNAEEFKRRNNLVDIPSETSIYLSTESDYSKLLIETSIQHQLSLYFLNYLKSSRQATELLPADLGLADETVSTMVEYYNEAVLKRNRILKGAGPDNPQAFQLKEQLESIMENIKSSVRNYVEILDLKLKELKTQQGTLAGKISEIPRKEREYREIERQQTIKEQLYLYLLQKREETALALSVSVSNAKVIDEAFSSGSIISPNKIFLLLIALFAGILLPIIIIYVIDLFDTKVIDSKALKELNVPYIGEIPSLKNNKKSVAIAGDKSYFSEAFRLIRTNISFLFKDRIEGGKVIFITSSLAREGKTFVSINLAAVTAAADKKVLLVGLDLRRQKLLQYLNLPTQKGISNFLIDYNSKIEDFIIPFPENSSIHILPSGDIPPNPSELLMKDRLKDVFDFARKNYDYVIVDTAPAGLVTDTVLTAHHADSVIYIIRANQTEKSTLSTPLKFYNENKLPNLAFLLNDVSNFSLGGYPYAYDYSYSDMKWPWWKRFWMKLF
ncbi:MAG: polysaccharide biosynthesis tyrosine autokinase [Bacteroidia bacterium]